MSTAELAERAGRLHVVVIGGGIGGLVAAWECAKVGLRVTVVEASEHLGGAVRSAEIDGLRIDAGAESFATRGGHVRALLDELGLSDRVVTPNPAGAWLAGIPGVGAAPLPAGSILGIPQNPFDDSVRRIIGWRGAWRAYLDRLRPPLTIGHERSLGRLVRSRMGERVLDRLVAPITAGVYSAHPDDIDTDVAAPGLNAALTRTGSLSGAVSTLIGEVKEKKRPGAAVEGLEGGLGQIMTGLAAALDVLGANVRTGTRGVAVQRDGAERPWSVELVSSDPGQDTPESGEAERIEADAVIVATEEPTARMLLGLPAASATAAPEIEIVTLLLDAPTLDAAPRGSGVLTVSGNHVAKALTHSTAKWGWLREAASPHHLVRVSFGAQGEPAATAELDDERAAALALREASALLGVPLDRTQLRGAHRARFIQSQPASLLGAPARRAKIREQVAARAGLGAVGAWLAGTGLAQVIPDARTEADRVRSALLWTDGVSPADDAE